MRKDDQDGILNLIRRISNFPDGARRYDMPSADRANDRIRQKARKADLIEYADRGKGFRWFLTGKGIKLLADHKANANGR